MESFQRHGYLFNQISHSFQRVIQQNLPECFAGFALNHYLYPVDRIEPGEGIDYGSQGHHFAGAAAGVVDDELPGKIYKARPVPDIDIQQPCAGRD